MLDLLIHQTSTLWLLICQWSQTCHVALVLCVLVCLRAPLDCNGISQLIVVCFRLLLDPMSQNCPLVLPSMLQLSSSSCCIRFWRVTLWSETLFWSGVFASSSSRICEAHSCLSLCFPRRRGFICWCCCLALCPILDLCCPSVCSVWPAAPRLILWGWKRCRCPSRCFTSSALLPLWLLSFPGTYYVITRL